MRRVAPYQIFFPIGIFSALVAVAVWLFRDAGWFENPVLLIHSRLIFGGFLWSFITGFLLTAVPRISGRETASWLEIDLGLALITVQLLSAWKSSGEREFYGAGLALGAFLLLFALKRFLRSARPLPVFVSHVGLGLLMALAGACAHLAGRPFLGLHLFEVGSVLLLVLGLGARFFSFLSGLPSSFELEKRPARHRSFHALGLTTCVFLFLAGEGARYAYFGLSLVTSLYVLFVWQAGRKSTRPSALKIGARVAAAALPFCFLLAGLFPALYIVWFHILFIGCFAIMAFSVATRVILAHGSYPIELETKTPALGFFIGLFCLALASRVLYGLAPGVVTRDLLLHVAMFSWILGVTVWSSSFLVRVWTPGREKKPAC